MGIAVTHPGPRAAATAEGGGLSPRGLDHVVVRVADLERALRFYRDALGLPIERRIDALGLVQLRAGGALIDLVPVDSPLGRAGGGPPDPNARNVDHFALTLARFDEPALRALFARFGVPASETAERYGAEGYGPSIYLTDPDGNTVELKGPATRGLETSEAPTFGAQTQPSASDPGPARGLGLEATKRAVLEAAQEMDRAGLVVGTAGNLSARTRSGQVVLTPTAMRYAEMTLDDLVVTDPSGRVLAGSRPPTTELALHLACLRRHPDIAAVAHTHPIHASMFAVCQQPIPCAIEELELYVGGDVPVTAYHRTGSEALGLAVAEQLHDRAAALLANHGLVVVAATPAEAIDLTKLVERAARIMAGAARLGTPAALPDTDRAAFRAAYLARRRGEPRPV
jgi:L-fuculose-phosphate aldolase